MRISVYRPDKSLEYYLSFLELSEEDRRFVHTSHPRRALEWAAARKTLNDMCGRRVVCQQDEVGKPHLLNDDHHVSLSHSHGLVAVAISDQPIGVDVQQLSPKIRRIRKKFVHEDDVQMPIDEVSEQILGIIWSAKEAMFKLYGKGEVDFKEHLRLDISADLPETGILHGRILKGDTPLSCEIHYSLIEDYTFAYAI